VELRRHRAQRSATITGTSPSTATWSSCATSRWSRT
jgi:hypothetical protein